ncbi:uncharacterized protein LOC134251554 isoform X2 [Saccostrea cucullata]|uniref:uncharacterized protein LOC134251554 isoform X2 n=1 Tax=Saccostrea cuccullata TaxID=36930 RepID=UPI002ED48BBD
MLLKNVILSCYLHQIYMIKLVHCLSYSHMVFQRYQEPSLPLTFSSAALTSSLVMKWTECFDLCRGTSQCASVFFDENNLNCSVFGENTEVKGVGENQRYYVMQKKVFYQDILSYSQFLCSEGGSGYVYDATVPVCYNVDPTPRTRPNAILSCENFNGHLLRINTQRKQKFVEDLNLTRTDLIHKYRIDGDKTSGVWKFSDGRLISELYWYPGEPASSSATSIGLRDGHMGKWDDIGEQKQHGTICERDLAFG